jgi:hypothetical protein
MPIIRFDDTRFQEQSRRRMWRRQDKADNARFGQKGITGGRNAEIPANKRHDDILNLTLSF